MYFALVLPQLVIRNYQKQSKAKKLVNVMRICTTALLDVKNLSSFLSTDGLNLFLSLKTDLEKRSRFLINLTGSIRQSYANLGD